VTAAAWLVLAATVTSLLRGRYIPPGDRSVKNDSA
jgi:hypothetical protein